MTPEPSAVRIAHANTAQLRVGERRAYWHEVVRDHIIQLDCHAESENDFLCAMDGYSCASGSVTHIHVARKLDVHRHGAFARGEPGEAVILNLVLQGGMQVSQADNRFLMREGDLSICTSDQPYDLTIPVDMRVATFRVPFESLDCSPSSLARLVAQPLGRSRMTPLLSAYARQLVNDRGEIARYSANVALKHLSTLLGAVVSEALPQGCVQPTLHRERIIMLAKHHIGERLSEEDLSVGSVAVALRVSTRYLQKLWQGEEESIADYIASRRLESVMKSLSNPARARESLTQIAFSHGFVNMSHFSRFFRSKVGVTPTAYRENPDAVSPPALRRRAV